MTYFTPRHLRDEELLSQIKTFVQTERDTVVKILHHLREIERRQLYSDLGYPSLFEYAVQELKYSESQASRRIQAMRLIKELPEVEGKIATGELSLSNVQQAQSLFRDIKTADPVRIVPKEEKLAILSKLENKSVREARKELMKLHPEAATPKESERIITETVSELRIPMSDTLRAKLEEVRSLLGPKGATLSYAELFAEMAEVSLDALKSKRFGATRVAAEKAARKDEISLATSPVECKNSSTPTNIEISRSNPRHISRELKHKVWQRDQGRCRQCGTTRNLNYDHIVPVGKGGISTPDNLRLLCFSCNQRASTKVYGTIYEKPHP